jgi:hypothetical protein
VGILNERVHILHAATELIQVVVSSEAIDETGSEVGHHVKGRQSQVALNWADSKGQSVGKISSGLEEELVVPVGFEGGNVALDFGLVEEPVLGQG